VGGFFLQEYYVEVGTISFKENLYRKLSELQSREGLPIDIHELRDDAQYLVRCVFTNIKGRQQQDSLTARIYNYYFARALAEIIFQGWEGLFVQKVLKKEYNLTNQEVESILQMARHFLNSEDKSYLPENRKHVLVKSILEYLDINKRFDIEGFMNFRADLYKKELKKQIAQVVNEYALEQEHDSFISLLQRFLDSQHTIYKTMHLVLKKNGEVKFLDECGKNINSKCLDENEAYFSDRADKHNGGDRQSNMELYEDFLISALLKCAPRKLVVHTATKQHGDLLQILQEVFLEKISFCKRCPLCCPESN